MRERPEVRKSLAVATCAIMVKAPATNRTISVHTTQRFVLDDLGGARERPCEMRLAWVLNRHEPAIAPYASILLKDWNGRPTMSKLRNRLMLCVSVVSCAALISALLQPQRLSASRVPPQSQADPRVACAADVQKLCPNVPQGGGRIIACLKQHKDEVSKAASRPSSARCSVREEAPVPQRIPRRIQQPQPAAQPRLRPYGERPLQSRGAHSARSTREPPIHHRFRSGRSATS